jgi:UDP-N-acetyl-D-mannosaminuronate dehydrogenase
VQAFTAAGFRCVGFDVDRSKVDRLTAGEGYIKHIDSSALDTAYDYDFIVERSSFVLDTRNATKQVTRGRETIRKA